MDKIALPDGLQICRCSMPGIDSSMYVAIEGTDALVVDPHISEDMMAALKTCGVKQLLIFLTHEHFDHISGVNALRRRFDCHVVCTGTAAEAIGDPDKNLAKFWEVLIVDKTPEEEAAWRSVKDEEYACQADETYSADMTYMWHDHKILTRIAPGHSPGGALLFLDDGVLFSGDNLVNGAGVICRCPGGNWSAYQRQTLPVFQTLSDDTVVLPGHGTADTLGNLRQFLVKFKRAEMCKP